MLIKKSIDFGFELNIKTVFDWACSKRNIRVIEMLLDNLDFFKYLRMYKKKNQNGSRA